MALFPQLSTGASTQFPFVEKPSFLTRVATQDDYAESVSREWPNPFGSWTMNLDQVSDDDASIVQAFFNAQYGQYGRFILLDPMRNLLLWSQDVTQAAWTVPGSIAVTSGIADPTGNHQAQQLINTSPAGALVVSQSIAAGPASQTLSPFPNCNFTASAWFKSGSGGSPTLSVTDGGSQTSSRTIVLTNTWVRRDVSINFASSASSHVSWQLSLPSGGVVQMYGAQLTYLPSAGPYDATTVRCGVHPVCRFNTDTLSRIYQGPGRSQIKLPVVEILG